jgi:hypothetical protein
MKSLLLLCGVLLSAGVAAQTSPNASDRNTEIITDWGAHGSWSRSKSRVRTEICTKLRSEVQHTTNHQRSQEK